MAEHVCPVWVGYLLASPLRKLLQNPRKILRPYVKEGMTALDIGCAMGFFSLPMAELVGPKGKIICVDLQEEMIRSLEKRAHRAGVADRIEGRQCSRNSLDLLDLKESVDFALGFAVVHEVPDPAAFFSQIHHALKPSGRMLVAEPRGHVSQSDFDVTVSIAESNGFHLLDRPRIRRSRSVLMGR